MIALRKEWKKYAFLFLAICALGFFRLLWASPVLSHSDARKYLNEGAKVIDVRTIGEFQSGHLSNTVNIPLDQLKSQFPAQFPDKSQVLLLHCRSGRRSNLAERELQAMGYTNAFNIGSYQQAKKVIGEEQQ